MITFLAWALRIAVTRAWSPTYRTPPTVPPSRQTPHSFCSLPPTADVERRGSLKRSNSTWGSDRKCLAMKDQKWTAVAVGSGGAWKRSSWSVTIEAMWRLVACSTRLSISARYWELTCPWELKRYSRATWKRITSAFQKLAAAVSIADAVQGSWGESPLHRSPTGTSVSAAQSITKP